MSYINTFVLKLWKWYKGHDGVSDAHHSKYTDAESVDAVETAGLEFDDNKKILVDEVKARDGDGLKLYDDGGNGIFIEDGGYVGVGISNPSSEFHVNTTRNTPAMRVQSTHADAANRWAGIEYIKLDGSAGVFTGLNGNTNEFRFNNVATGGYIDFMIGSNSKLKIINLGYVGVGITPTSELHVNTTRNTPPLRIQSTHADASNRWAGIEYLKSDGNAGVFTGLRGSTNEFRFNNVATSGFISLMIGSAAKLTVANNGKIGISTASPTASLDVNSDVIRLRTAKTPATAGAAGNQGDWCWDADYFYICVATNTWRRAQHFTW